MDKSLTLDFSRHQLNIIYDGLMYLYENSETEEYRTEARELATQVQKILGGVK